MFLFFVFIFSCKVQTGKGLRKGRTQVMLAATLLKSLLVIFLRRTFPGRS